MGCPETLQEEEELFRAKKRRQRHREHTLDIFVPRNPF